MKNALVHDNRICEFGVPFPVHDGLVWVEVADTTTTSDTYVDGAVVKAVPYVPTVRDEILRLEAEATPRRIREAVLGTDEGWLAQQEELIKIERAKL